MVAQRRARGRRGLGAVGGGAGVRRIRPRRGTGGDTGGRAGSRLGVGAPSPEVMIDHQLRGRGQPIRNSARILGPEVVGRTPQPRRRNAGKPDQAFIRRPADAPKFLRALEEDRDRAPLLSLSSSRGPPSPARGDVFTRRRPHRPAQPLRIDIRKRREVQFGHQVGGDRGPAVPSVDVLSLGVALQRRQHRHPPAAVGRQVLGQSRQRTPPRQLLEHQQDPHPLFGLPGPEEARREIPEEEMAEPAEPPQRRLRHPDNQERGLTAQPAEIDLLPGCGSLRGRADGLVAPRLEAGGDALKNPRLILWEHGEVRAQPGREHRRLWVRAHVGLHARRPGFADDPQAAEGGRAIVRSQGAAEHGAEMPLRPHPVDHVGVRRIGILKELGRELLGVPDRPAAGKRVPPERRGLERRKHLHIPRPPLPLLGRPRETVGFTVLEIQRDHGDPGAGRLEQRREHHGCRLVRAGEADNEHVAGEVFLGQPHRLSPRGGEPREERRAGAVAPRRGPPPRVAQWQPRPRRTACQPAQLRPGGEARIAGRPPGPLRPQAEHPEPCGRRDTEQQPAPQDMLMPRGGGGHERRGSLAAPWVGQAGTQPPSRIGRAAGGGGRPSSRERRGDLPQRPGDPRCGDRDPDGEEHDRRREVAHGRAHRLRPFQCVEPEPDGHVTLTLVEREELQASALGREEQGMGKMPHVGALHIAHRRNPLELLGQRPVGIDPGNPGEQGLRARIHLFTKQRCTELGFEKVRREEAIVPPQPLREPASAGLIERNRHETGSINVREVHSRDSRNRVRAPGLRASGPRGPVGEACRSSTPSSSRCSSRWARSGFRVPSGRISATSRPRCEMTMRCPARTFRMISLKRALASYVEYVCAIDFRLV